MTMGTVIHKRPNPANLVPRWKGAPHTIEHVRDGANAVYRFCAGETRLVLRLTEGRHRNRGQLEAEVDFVRFVTSRGVAAAGPVPTVDGGWVETLTPGDVTGVWHAVAFTWVSGCHFKFFTADVDRPLFCAMPSGRSEPRRQLTAGASSTGSWKGIVSTRPLMLTCGSTSRGWSA